jgi:rhodanese-related sulfurtransferase
MDQLIQFVVNHWLLGVALVLVIVLLVYEETKRNVRGVQQVSPQQLTNLINRENAVVVDVREANSFEQGHIISAIHIPLTKLEESINKLSKYKSKPIILVCDIGQMSPRAGAILRKQGFEKIYFLSGGIAAWQRAGLPMVKD